MIDLDKLQQAAEAAIAKNADDPTDWYPWERLIDGVDYAEDAAFIADASPQTILKLIAVARAAQDFSCVCDSFKATIPIPPPIAALREALEALK